MQTLRTSKNPRNRKPEQSSEIPEQNIPGKADKNQRAQNRRPKKGSDKREFNFRKKGDPENEAKKEIKQTQAHT